MCRACGDPLSSPFVSTVTEATSPFSVTVALPLPVTWFDGTGCAAAVNGCPFGLDEPPPELNTITAITAPTITTSPARIGSGERFVDFPAAAGGPGGPAAGDGFDGTATRGGL